MQSDLSECGSVKDKFKNYFSRRSLMSNNNNNNTSNNSYSPISLSSGFTLSSKSKESTSSSSQSLILTYSESIKKIFKYTDLNIFSNRNATPNTKTTNNNTMNILNSTNHTNINNDLIDSSVQVLERKKLTIIVTSSKENLTLTENETTEVEGDDDVVKNIHENKSDFESNRKIFEFKKNEKPKRRFTIQSENSRDSRNGGGVQNNHPRTKLVYEKQGSFTVMNNYRVFDKKENKPDSFGSRSCSTEIILTSSILNHENDPPLTYVKDLSVDDKQAASGDLENIKNIILIDQENPIEQMKKLLKEEPSIVSSTTPSCSSTDSRRGSLSSMQHSSISSSITTERENAQSPPTSSQNQMFDIVRANAQQQVRKKSEQFYIRRKFLMQHSQKWSNAALLIEDDSSRLVPPEDQSSEFRYNSTFNNESLDSASALNNTQNTNNINSMKGLTQDSLPSYNNITNATTTTSFSNSFNEVELIRKRLDSSGGITVNKVNTAATNNSSFKRTSRKLLPQIPTRKKKNFQIFDILKKNINFNRNNRVNYYFYDILSIFSNSRIYQGVCFFYAQIFMNFHNFQ
jgi:hypothetical protein